MQHAKRGERFWTLVTLLSLGACNASAITGLAATAERDAAADLSLPDVTVEDRVALDLFAPVDLPVDRPDVADVAVRCDAGRLGAPNRWTAIASESTGSLEGVWGAGCSTVWVVGEDGSNGVAGLILRWDGARWERITSPEVRRSRAGFHDVWGAENDLWVVGGFTVSTEGVVLHWNGSTWTLLAREANAVWGRARDDVWIGGGYGEAARWDGAGWQTLSAQGGFPTDPFGAFFRGAITDVWGARDVWFVGIAAQRTGTVVRSAMGGALTAMVAAPRDLRGVWGSGDDDVWAVGGEGTIAHWNGASWSRVESGTRAGLVGVWGSGPSDVWAVGEQGTILRWRGSAWEAVPSPTTQTLNALWGRSAGDVWAVGDGGTVLRWSE